MPTLAVRVSCVAFNKTFLQCSKSKKTKKAMSCGRIFIPNVITISDFIPTGKRIFHFRSKISPRFFSAYFERHISASCMFLDVSVVYGDDNLLTLNQTNGSRRGNFPFLRFYPTSCTPSALLLPSQDYKQIEQLII